jgi:SAM-dependent methyltransferase
MVFRKEAARLAGELAKLEVSELSPLLNIGSSTLEFRTKSQPWVDELIFQPLVARGVKIVHVDIREGAGIDIRADLLKDEDYARLKAEKPKTVLLCNILEHVLDPATFARRAFDLLGPGGRLYVTVPNSYPHHNDPIDTMFRPTPQEVAALAPEAELAAGEIIDTGSYWDELKKRPWIITRQIFRAPFPFLGFTKWKRSMKKFYWLVRPYRVTLAILRRPPAP